MNELLTRCLEEDEVNLLGEMPPELLNDHEREWVDFILKFDRAYGASPSVSRLVDEFDSFIPFRFTASLWEDKPPPLGDVFQRTVERKLFHATERILADVESTMSREGHVPLERLAEIERLHTMSLGVYRYSTFDRSLYFRRSRLNLPFPVVNRRMGGLGNGDFLLLVGRLGTGKSTIAQWIAKHAWKRGMTVLFVSAEMLAADVFSRIDAMMGKFNPLVLRSESPEAMAEEMERAASRARGEGGEIIIPRSQLITPTQIGSFAKNLMVDLIVVDGAYLLQPSSGRYSSKWEKVATVSNELKQLALSLDLPIIGTAQIKRGASGAEGYDPEDIALSDALGQDADFVLALYPNPVIKGRSELQLIKNRFGPGCATQIYVDYGTMTITDETTEGSVRESRTLSPKEWLASSD